MDRIDLYRIFVRVVDSGNITRAAASLGLARSSVSAAIQELEGRLGALLLQRNTRRLSVTPDGAALYARCGPLISDAEQIETLFRGGPDGPEGRVRLDVPSRIGRRLIAPALPRLLDRYPALDVDLGMTDQPSDLIADGVDCIVRVGSLDSPRLACRRLGLLDLVNVASPGYLDRFGIPTGPADLDRHQAIGYGPGGQGREAAWDWDDAGQPRSRPVPARVTVNNVEGYIGCCLAGLGLIQVPRYDVRHHLEAGNLVEILDAWRPAPLPLSLLTAARDRLPPRLEVVIDWLVDVLATATAPATGTGAVPVRPAGSRRRRSDRSAG